MKSKVLLIAVFFTVTVSAQNKYWINLKDKSASVSKSELQTIFSEKALSKKLSEPNQIDWYDYPVKSDYIKQIENSGAKIINQSRWLNSVSVFATPEQILRISEFQFVKSVEGVVRLKNHEPEKGTAISTHPISKNSSATTLDYGSSATQINLTKLSALHDLGITGNGISVGLIDEGTKWQDHEAFVSLKLGEQKNFVVVPEGQPASTFNHGTATLSLMGAYKPGSMIGGTFDSKFYLAETEYGPITDYAFEEDNLVAAIEWMEAKGVDVINISLGYLDFLDKTSYSFANGDLDGNTALCTKAADIAAQKGVAMFVAAGNEGNTLGKVGSLNPPSDGFHVFASGAVSSSGTIASFSSRGPTNDGRIKPDAVSMGVSCLVATPASNKKPVGDYEFGNGTSYASPLSASAGALILSVYPELTSEQVYDALRSTANKTNSPNNDYGYGLIDAEKALYKIGPAISNQFSISYLGSKLTFKGFLKWEEAISPTQTKLILYISSVDSTVFENTLFSGDSVSFSGNFNATVNDTIHFKIIGKTSSDKSFSYPINNDFKRRFVYGNYMTLSEPLRRAGKNGSKYFTDTIEQKPKPVTFEISNPYPNPFNPETKFSVFSTQATSYTVLVYNAMGQVVDSFYGQLSANDYKIISWNSVGKNASSGLYFFQFNSGKQNKVMKAVLLK